MAQLRFRKQNINGELQLRQSVSDKPPDHSEFMPEPREKFLCQRAPIKVTFILIGSVPGVKGADTSISKLAFLSFTVPLTVISA